MPSIHLQHDGAIARLFIDHAERRNAITRQMWRSIPGLLEQAIARAGTCALVLQSRVNGCFGAGADISEFASTYATKAESLRASAEIRNAVEALATYPLPTVALIDGPCVGGAVALALACDVRLASDRASFAVTPAKLGLSYHPHDVTRLVRTCGRAGAAELLFSGAAWTAERALRDCLVNAVVPQGGLDAAAEALLCAISANSLDALRALKRAISATEVGGTKALSCAEDEFNALFAGPDFLEGRDAFLAKRQPQFPSHIGRDDKS